MLDENTKEEIENRKHERKLAFRAVCKMVSSQRCLGRTCQKWKIGKENVS